MFAMAVPFLIKFAWGVAIIDVGVTAAGMK